MLNLARDNIVALPVHDSFIVRMSHQIDLHEEMDRVFEEFTGVKSKRDKGKTVFNDQTKKTESNKLFNNKGETLEGAEGVIIKGSDINFEELMNLSEDYKGYNLREGQWRKYKEYN